jgi:hypothetical protein
MLQKQNPRETEDLLQSEPSPTRELSSAWSGDNYVLNGKNWVAICRVLVDDNQK